MSWIGQGTQRVLALALLLSCGGVLFAPPTLAVGVTAQTQVILPVPFARANRGTPQALLRTRWREMERAIGQMLMVGFPGT
ncbi:MAG: hypothetical protein AAFO79_03495, partial [Pseudomonadota bacterium]